MKSPKYLLFVLFIELVVLSTFLAVIYLDKALWILAFALVTLISSAGLVRRHSTVIVSRFKCKEDADFLRQFDVKVDVVRTHIYKGDIG